MEGTSIRCSCCGAPCDRLALRKGECRSCGSALIVTSLPWLDDVEPAVIRHHIEHHTQVLRGTPDSAESLLALGLCYLKLGLFEPCDDSLRRLQLHHPALAGGYFYRALAKLRGARPKRCSLDTVREALKLLEAAAHLEPRNGLFDACTALVVHDYFVTTGMRVPPPGPVALLDRARDKHIDGAQLGNAIALLRLPDSDLKAACLELT